MDESENLTLDGIRNSLIRQEDSIIFSLLERSQYCYNADTYEPTALSVNGFHGSLVEFMVRETERLHAQVCHTDTSQRRMIERKERSDEERREEECYFWLFDPHLINAGGQIQEP